MSFSSIQNQTKFAGMAIHTRGLKVETWKVGHGNEELEIERDSFKQ
jgi:hypothetical protein